LIIGLIDDITIVDNSQPAVCIAVDSKCDSANRSIAHDHSKIGCVGAAKGVVILYAGSILMGRQSQIRRTMLVAIVARKHRFIIAHIVRGTPRGEGACVALGALVLLTYHVRLGGAVSDIFQLYQTAVITNAVVGRCPSP